MSLGPAVLRQQSVPFLSLACLLFTVFFVIQGFLVSGLLTVLSLVIAAIFAAAGLWFWFQARRSSVLIDREQFIVKDGAKQETFQRSDIESIDLASLRGHVRFKDGSSLTLPLEGKQLVEAGLLLSPESVVE